MKNFITFAIIGIVLSAAGYFFFKGSAPVDNLVSAVKTTTNNLAMEKSLATSEQDAIIKKSLSLLLNAKNITINDSILTEQSFLNLKDSSIVITPEGNEGRPNPFAQIGSDSMEAVAASANWPSLVPGTNTTIPAGIPGGTTTPSPSDSTIPKNTTGPSIPSTIPAAGR